jgi:hypothetical protein
MQKIRTKIETATTKSERNMIDLGTGKKKPSGKSDQRLLAQIEVIKKKGKMVYIPHD